MRGSLFTRNWLFYYNDKGLFQEAILKIKEMKKELPEYENKFNPIYKIDLWVTFSLSYFGIEDYDKCLYWVNKIRNESNLDVRRDMEISMKLFYLILQYEKQNYDLLPYLIRSTYRYLLRKKRLFKFENIILDFLRKDILKIKSKKELIRSFKKLKNKLELLPKGSDVKQGFEDFDYMSWLESKIENRPFAEVIRDKLPD